MIEAVLIVSAMLAAYWFGWVMAHSVVAKECERLGGFYVGTKVFHCSEIEVRQREAIHPPRPANFNPPPMYEKPPAPPAPPKVACCSGDCNQGRNCPARRK